MNNTMTQSTQLKLLEITSEIEKNRQALKGIYDNCYIGCGSYYLLEAVSDIEIVLKHIKDHVLQMEEDEV